MSRPRIIAIDAGYANMGVAVMELREVESSREWWPIDLACIQTEKSHRKTGLRQSDDHARRIAESTRELKGLVLKHKVDAALVELPPAGSQNANVARTLAFAAAQVTTFVECMGLATEWFTPSDTRRAAGVSSGITDKDHVKEIVMAEMGKKYPSLEVLFKAKERRNHVADALATFEAGRHGNLVRMLEARRADASLF